MTRYKVIILMFVLAVVFAVGVASEDAFASDFVESSVSCPSPSGMSGAGPKDNGFFDCAIVNGHHDDKSGGTYFDIDLRESGKCKKVDCEVVKQFRCITPGGWYLETVNNSKTEITKTKTSGGWDYYEVKLHTAWASWYSGHTIQEAKGTIRVKHETTEPTPPTRRLKIQKVDIETLDYLGDEIVAGSFKEDGETHTLTWTNNGVSGYKFIGFKTSDNEESGTDHIIERTSCSTHKTCVSDPYDSGVVYYRYNSDDFKTIYKTVHAKLKNSSRTILAFYAKKYKLDINNENTTVSVKREWSLYAKRVNINTNSNLYYDDFLDICAKPLAGYTFVELKINNKKRTPYGDCAGGGKAYDYPSVTGDTTISAKAIKNKFQGKATVTGGGDSASTEFVEDDRESNGGNAALLKIDCPSTGCSATFSMDLKTTQGSGSTTYDIYRDGNQVSGYVGKSIAPSGSGSNVGSFTVDMQQGDLVCYEMNFDAIPADKKIVTVEACAAAVATETANINIDIRDMTSGSDYRDWQSRHNRNYVYAKPRDIVEFKGTFTPKYQYMVGLMPVTTKIGSSSYSNGGRNIRTVFNANVSPNWNNAFSIDLNRSSCKNLASNDGGQTEYNGIFLGTVGSSSAYSGVCDYGVKVSDVGENSNTAKSVTNSRNKNGEIPATKTTPKQITLDFSFNTGFVATIDNSKIESDPVEVRVPYNFENEAKFNIADDKFYAGEEKTINYDLIVGTRQNSVTNGTYATNVPGAKWKLLIDYSDGVHSEVDHLDGENLNYNNYDKNGKTSSKRDGISIRDVPAGTEICLTLEFWPVYSGTDTNMQSSSFSGWARDQKCYKIAKKPSFQVWGGSVYSAKNVNTLVANKLVYGGIHTFGSWTELSLVANGTVTGMSSGSGMGYAYNGSSYENGVWPGYNPSRVPQGNNYVAGNDTNGGGKGSFCDRSTLTFANATCSGGSAGFKKMGGGNNNTSKRDLISDFAPGDKTKYNLNSDEFSWYVLNNNTIDRLSHHVQDSETEYYYDSVNSGSLSVNFQYYNTIIPVKRESNRGTYTSTIVIDSERDVHLMSDIHYDDSSSYAAIEDIPKVIIYSKKDINIDCSVQRIDAVLIAEGDINTCTVENVNSSSRSNRLVINGATISNTLTLNRTYGAATQYNSIIPAEIINYDSSLYLWGSKQADATNSGELTEASIRELAPRY